jgi:hypothetical protein
MTLVVWTCRSARHAAARSDRLVHSALTLVCGATAICTCGYRNGFSPDPSPGIVNTLYTDKICTIIEHPSRWHNIPSQTVIEAARQKKKYVLSHSPLRESGFVRLKNPSCDHMEPIGGVTHNTLMMPRRMPMNDRWTNHVIGTTRSLARGRQRRSRSAEDHRHQHRAPHRGHHPQGSAVT